MRTSERTPPRRETHAVQGAGSPRALMPRTTRRSANLGAEPHTDFEDLGDRECRRPVGLRQGGLGAIRIRPVCRSAAREQDRLLLEGALLGPCRPARGGTCSSSGAADTDPWRRIAHQAFPWSRRPACGVESGEPLTALHCHQSRHPEGGRPYATSRYSGDGTHPSGIGRA